MTLIDLPTALAHLRLDAGYPEEQVAPYLEAAEQSAADFLNRRIFVDEAALATAVAAVPAALVAAGAARSAALDAAALIEDEDARTAAEAHAERVYLRAREVARETYDGIVMNGAIRAAILLTLGHLFENRQDTVSGVSVVELPMGARSLLWPHRVGLGA